MPRGIERVRQRDTEVPVVDNMFQIRVANGDLDDVSLSGSTGAAG